MLYTILYNFSASSSQVSYKVRRQSFTEIIWETIPALIFCVIAIPSFTLLYSLDEVIEPSLTIKDIGLECYSSYEYGNYEVHDGLVTNGITFNLQNGDHGMISPSEPPNTGWYSGFKNWWFNKDNQPLSPMEANQKTLGELDKVKTSTFDRCKKHDDVLLNDTLSPRSHAVAVAKREECYLHYDALSKCSHQVSLNIAQTEYNSPPTTFSASFGNALGQKVGEGTKSLYTEMAKNAVTTTAESLKREII